MYVCENEHEEIVYDGRGKCPLCTATDDIQELKNKIENLEDQIEKLQEEFNPNEANR